MEIFKIKTRNGIIYNLPRYNIIDLYVFRKHMIDSRRSEEIDLVDKIDRLISFDTIHQFPLPIYNKRLWKSLCKSDTSNNFIVDLFIPELSLAIEADYDSTHNKLYDIARDNYIKKIYKIDTMRVNNYKGICSWEDRDRKLLTDLTNTINMRELKVFDFDLMFKNSSV